MKRVLIVVGFIGSLAISQIANATTVTYTDTAVNWGTWTSTTPAPNGTAEQLGVPNFNSTSVTTNNGFLQSIVFNGTIDGYSDTVVSGDLFINKITSAGDTSWDYVVRSLGNTLNGSASSGLYSINVDLYDASAYAYSSYPYVANNTNTAPNTQFRAGLPVGLLSTPDVSSLIGNLGVGFSSNATGITFNFNDPLFLDSSFIIGYTITCANDVVYQEVPVPEPGTLILLGAGLLGLVGYKRRMSKKA